MHRSDRTSRFRLSDQPAGWTVWLLFLLMPLSHAVEGAAIGGIVASQGEIQAGSAAEGRQGVLHDGDRIRTGSASWALLELQDASRLVIGPDTALKISMRVADNRHYLDLELESGLLRVVTGLACNRSLDDCVLHTPYGEVRLFDARADVWVCEDDCAGANPSETPGSGGPAGRVVFVRGRLFRVGDFGVYRRLLSDDGVYLSDELIADRDSCAVIAFNDGSVLSLADGQRVNASDPVQRQGAGGCPDWKPEAGLNFRAMFVTRDSSRLSHGVFARVVDGHVRLGDGDAQTGIGRGESAYMGNGRPLRISAWPKPGVLEQAPDPYRMARRGP